MPPTSHICWLTTTLLRESRRMVSCKVPYVHNRNLTQSSLFRFFGSLAFSAKGSDFAIDGGGLKLSRAEPALEGELLEVSAVAAWAASNNNVPSLSVSVTSKLSKLRVGGSSPSSKTPRTMAPLPWVRACCERLSLRENFLPQSRHSKGLSWVWRDR